MVPIDFEPGRDALFFDLDGTLVDIVSEPDAATAPSGLVELLKRLTSRLGGALAILSGRPIGEIDRILAPLAPPAAGIHGAELRLVPHGDIQSLSKQIPDRLRLLIAKLAEIPDVRIEDKGSAIAVHYRGAENPDTGEHVQRALETVLKTVSAGDLVILAGKCVFEIKPVTVGKDTGLEALMAVAPFQGRRPVVIGDDVTDEYAFAAAAKFGGVGIAVGHRRPGATHAVASPDEVRVWMQSLVGAEVAP